MLFASSSVGGFAVVIALFGVRVAASGQDCTLDKCTDGSASGWECGIVPCVNNGYWKADNLCGFNGDYFPLYEKDLDRMGIRQKNFEKGATNGCNLYTRKHGSKDTPKKLKEFKCVSDPHDDHPEECTSFDSIHHDDKLKIGSEAKDKGKCEDEQVDFVYVAASPRGTITGGWCDASNTGKLGDEVCVPCGGDDGTTEATTTTTVTTKDTSGSVNMYPKGPIRFNKQCPAGSCGEGNKKCEGELVFGYLTAKALHGAHYHDNMNGFSNHFWIFQSDWVKMGCDLVSVKTFQSYIYNPNGKVAAQGPILSRCAGKGDGKDPNTGAATSYMDWPNYRKEGFVSQKGAKVGWIIASAINCKKQTIPTCKKDQWYSKKASKCQACAPADGKCNDGEFMVGKCEATANTLSCKKCLAPNSNNGFCPGARQYRQGSCSGTANGFSCKMQPTCAEENTYLADFTKTVRGSCKVCDNAKCEDGKYRKGKCGGNPESGVMNAFTCSACDNAECSGTAGAEEYQTGTCSGVDNNLDCNKCANAECSEGSYRSGTCTKGTKGFVCNDQPKCVPGQFYKASTNADGSEGMATCEACPEGTHQSQGYQRLPTCESNSECLEKNDEHTLIAASATGDVVCKTSKKCLDYQYESKPIGSNNGRECSRLTTCQRGSYVVTAATATSDRECGKCDGKVEFSADQNVESCTPFKFCTTNERVGRAGSSTKDLTCSACPWNTEMPKDEHQEKYCDKITTTRSTTTVTTTTTTSVTTMTDTTTTTTSSTSTSSTSPDLPPIAVDLDEADRDAADAHINSLTEHIQAAEKQKENAEKKIVSIETVPYNDRTDNQNRDLIKAKSDLTDAVDKMATYGNELEDTQDMIADIDASALWSQQESATAKKEASTTTVVIVVMVLVILAVVGGAVMIVKRSNGSSSGGSADGVASFENPFYASAPAPAAASSNNSVLNNATYMDVPADHAAGSGPTGYTDISPNLGASGGQSGYMDVAPKEPNNNDDDSDDEEV